MSQALNRTIDSNEALPNAAALLMAAHAVANVPIPVAPRNISRRTRGLHRSTVALVQHGIDGTRRLKARKHIGTSFARSVTIPQNRGRQMANALLMSASTQPRAKTATASPRVSTLELIMHRAQAMQLVGTLRRRFAENAVDMSDGRADTERMYRVQARYPALRPVMA